MIEESDQRPSEMPGPSSSPVPGPVDDDEEMVRPPSPTKTQMDSAPEPIEGTELQDWLQPFDAQLEEAEEEEKGKSEQRKNTQVILLQQRNNQECHRSDQWKKEQNAHVKGLVPWILA